MELPRKPCVFTFLREGSLKRKGLGCKQVEGSRGGCVPLAGKLGGKGGSQPGRGSVRGFREKFMRPK